MPQLSPLFPVTSAARSLKYPGSRTAGCQDGRPIPASPGRTAPPSDRDRARQPSLLRIGKPGTPLLQGCPALAPVPDLASIGLAPPPATPRRRDRQNAFLNIAADRGTVAPDRVAAPVSPNVLQAGAVISAALITGIRSRSTRPDHRAGHRKHLRQPNRPYLACAAGTRVVGRVRQQRAVRPEPESCSSGLGSSSERALDRSRAPATAALTLKGSPGCRMASITIGGIWPGCGIVDTAKRRHAELSRSRQRQSARSGDPETVGGTPSTTQGSRLWRRQLNVAHDHYSARISHCAFS